MPTYQDAAPIPPAIREELRAYDDLIAQLLCNRGIATKAAAEAFLQPKYDDRPSPFLLHDMEKAVARILRATANHERIAVFADYDCDGIPGAVVLHDFFTAIGFTNFTTYIPHRHYEGFGLSTEAVHKLQADTVDLIITVDCGISDHTAVAAANVHGIDVIITDHHESKADLPEALAVVNPKVGDTYPFPDLCGAAVAFRLVEALIERGEFALRKGQEKWWLDLVGMATIGDMVPLIGENRTLATYGLTVLKKSRRPGLQQLLQKNRLRAQHLTEDDVGFTLGPRINASSRMDTPESAFQLLAETDVTIAGQHADTLERLNTDRKTSVATMTKAINKRLKDMTDVPSVIVMGDPQWRPALVGLAASKLAETYNRPAFLWGRDGNGVLKGSARTAGNVSILHLLEAVADELLEYGGHHQSGGFAVREEAIHTLSQKLQEAAESHDTTAPAEPLLVDQTVMLDDIHRERMQQIEKLAPFGMGNPKPLFKFVAVTPTHVDVFGKGKEHTKLVFDTAHGQIEAIAFFKTPEQFAVEPQVGSSLTLLAHPETSYFMGRHSIRLRIVDIL